MLLLPIALLLLATSLVTVAGAAVGRPTELTPDDMGEFSFECRFENETIKKGAEPPRPTGVTIVRVIFDAEKGPGVTKMNAATLVVRDGEEAILVVPIQWSGGARPGFIQFFIHERMLLKASIVLTNDGQDNAPSVAIPLGTFYGRQMRERYLEPR